MTALTLIATTAFGLEKIVKNEVKEVLLYIDKELSKSQLATALGHKSISGKLNQRIRQLLVDKIIE